MTENVQSITDHGDAEVENASESAEQEEVQVETPLTRQQALNKAYSTATARLREEHREEFEKFYVEEAAALGVEYRPKPTPEQKAEEEVRELLAKYPQLRERIAPAK